MFPNYLGGAHSQNTFTMSGYFSLFSTAPESLLRCAGGARLGPPTILHAARPRPDRVAVRLGLAAVGTLGQVYTRIPGVGDSAAG